MVKTLSIEQYHESLQISHCKQGRQKTMAQHLKSAECKTMVNLKLYKQ